MNRKKVVKLNINLNSIQQLSCALISTYIYAVRSCGHDKITILSDQKLSLNMSDLNINAVTKQVDQDVELCCI